MKLLLIIAAALMAISTSTHAADQRASFYDRNGHFQGSSVRNQYGTTTYYDRNGHFIGTEKKR